MKKRLRTSRTLLAPRPPALLACGDDCGATFYGTPAEAEAAGWDIDYPGMKLRARCPYHSTRERSRRSRYVPGP